MKLYELSVNHELMNTYSCFAKCFYEFLKVILHIKNNKYVKIKVINNEMIVDELSVYVDGEYELSMYSKYKNIIYNIHTMEEVSDFVYLYIGEKHVSSEILFSLMFLIKTINNTGLFGNSSNQDITMNKNKPTINKKEKKEHSTLDELSEKEHNKFNALDKLAELESKLMSKQLIKNNEPIPHKFNAFDKIAELESKLMSKQLIKNDESIPSKPTIEKVSYLEQHDTESSSNTSCSSSSRSSKSSSTSRCYSEFSKFCNENMEIYEMERTKEKIQSLIQNAEKTIDKEDFDLAVYAGELDKVRILEEKETQKMKDKLNQFESQKNFTYKTIYNDFFIKKIISSWDDIPVLFSANFAIFLYLDGKDNDGNDVRPKILDTDDEYRMYNLLLLALTDDAFELPDSESDKIIITDFLDTLPPITLLSSDNIMKSLNDPENDLFENDTTSLNSGANEECGNDTYN
jgi:hypothetical protein